MPSRLPREHATTGVPTDLSSMSIGARILLYIVFPLTFTAAMIVGTSMVNGCMQAELASRGETISTDP